MRKRIIGRVLLVLISLLLFALFNVNLFVERSKDYLVGRLEKALEGKVSVDKIDVALWPVGVRFVNFAVAGDPAFSPGDFVRAKDLRLEFRALPLLIGRLRLKRIALESPAISVVRDAAGRYNFASHAGNEKNDRDGAHNSKKASAAKRNDRWFLIAFLAVFNGTLRYRDLKNGAELTAMQINLEISDFQWDEPFDVRLEAAVMAAEQNLKLKIRAGPIAGKRDYRDVPLVGELQADAVDLGKINAALPQFRKALPRALRFSGVYTVRDLKFKGTLNDLSLKGTVTGTDASFRFE
jgi:uncharacterized protein involved in outer membrane biogenesis